MNISVPSEWKVLVSLFANNIVKMLSHVLSITLHSVNITCCKLWQRLDNSYCTEMQKSALLMYAIYPFKSSNLHITVCGILIERDCFEIFELLRIWSISQYLAAPLSHCKVMIDNMVYNSGPYFIWYAPPSLASSSVLPLHPSSMHPYSSSSSRLLTLIVF